IYETVPVGYTDQPDFFNMVVCMATALEPLDLLEACQGAERSRLRERVIHWGPRTLDVDILLYDDVAMDTPILTLPHPRMAERAFVMGPMAEMDPDLAVNLALPDGSIDFTGILHKIPAIDVKIRIANR
ncbi:MAG: 2-amino-4-hydroxy-6-hydroxymethyldihydropteridine diphosphokinase, partial [Clostridiales bacterium]|nr:2-amino-4-hydroxy-6-hydroxymethyldihydropteridine diphosphokinase [Clostridiales bacterium]